MPSTATRSETDSFGPIDVPADAYWGAQTERSIGNFPFGPREQMPLEIVHALGFIKQAAGTGERAARGARPKIAEVIQQAAAEVARGDLDNQFPLVIWQTGSGTQSNMNANEVIAGRANEILAASAAARSRSTQRPRQQEPVVQRQLPDSDAHRRGARGPEAPASGAEAYA